MPAEAPNSVRDILIPLISGLGGALIGALATAALYLVDRRRRERNAGRVLRVELANNVAALADFRKKGIATIALTNELWLHLATDLSGLLQKDFKTLSYAYYLTPLAEAIRRDHVKNGRTHLRPDEMEVLDKVRQGLKDALAVLAKKIGDPLPTDTGANPPT